MGVLDGPLRSVSKQLLDQFGTSVTLKRETGGSYDTSSREVTGGSDESQTVSGTLDKYKARYGQTADDGHIESGDRKLTIPALELDWVPEVGDQAVLEGHEFEVLDAHPVYSGDEVAVYELHLRR